MRDYNKKDHTMVVLTPLGPHEINFLSAERPDSPRGIPNIGWVLGDEIAMWKEDAWRNLRMGLADNVAPFLGLTTPKYEVGTIWLKELCDRAEEHWHDSSLPWDERYFYINWSIHDNPYILQKEKENFDNEFSGDWHSQEVMGRFVEGGMLIFSSLNFQTYDWNKIDFKAMEYYMTVDPAYTEDEIVDRSQSSITIAGMAGNRGMYFMENPHGYWDPDELVTRIVAGVRKYKIRKMGYERTTGAILLEKLLVEAFEREGIYCEVVPLPLIGNANKVARAQVMVPYIKQGMYKFPTVNGVLTVDADEAIKQFKSFPLGRLSDIVDSNAHMFHRDMDLIEGFGSIIAPERKKVENPVMTLTELDDYYNESAYGGEAFNLSVN